MGGLDLVTTVPDLALHMAGGGGLEGEAGLLAGLDAYRRQQRAATVVARLRAAKLGDLASA